MRRGPVWRPYFRLIFAFSVGPVRRCSSFANRSALAKVFLRRARKRFDTLDFLPYTLSFVRGSFAQAVTRPGVWARVVGRIFSPGTMHDGMGAKSGRNGTPVPQSRVSLSESKPRA